MCTLREALHIHNRGHECGIPVFAQNWHNGLLTVCNAHFLAALPEAHVLDQFVGQGPLQWDILKEDPIDNGYFNLPPGAGWGVALADNLEEKLPWIPGSWGEREER
jgi:L-alanine-DL-glutamate epimerase-like enolase superfamily enzyme